MLEAIFRRSASGSARNRSARVGRRVMPPTIRHYVLAGGWRVHLAAHALHNPGTDTDLASNLQNANARGQASAYSGLCSVRHLWTPDRVSCLCALLLGPCEACNNATLDHRVFELGKHAHHLEH